MNRPLGVTIIAILVALSGIAAVVMGVPLLLAGSDMLLAGLSSIVFGAALLYVAWGLWTLKHWAWLTTLILEGINGLFSLVGIILAPGNVSAWITLIVVAIIVYYLTRPHVRAVFAERRPIA